MVWKRRFQESKNRYYKHIDSILVGKGRQDPRQKREIKRVIVKSNQEIL